MKRSLIAASALLAISVAGCSTGGVPTSPASTAPPTSTTTAVPTTSSAAAGGLGIVTASCSTGDTTMVVSSHKPDGSMGLGQTFDGALVTPDFPTGLCARFGGANYDEGKVYGSLFNSDFTAYVTSHNVDDSTTTGQTEVGWLMDIAGYNKFIPVSTAAGKYIKQANINPMYHDGRVYYWAINAETPQLMSVGADGKDTRSEPALGAQFPYLQPQANIHGEMYMPATTAPLIVDSLDGGNVFNKAGTLMASASSQKLRIGRPDMVNGQEKPITGQFSGTLMASSFGADDNTLILRDAHQVYSLNVSTGVVTTLFKNNLLKVWDPTISPDGKTVAFLANDGKKAMLFATAADGSTANNPTELRDFNTQWTVDILAYR